MSSRASSSSRDTVIHLRQEDSAFPITPKKKEQVDAESPALSSHDSSTIPNLRERRRNLTSNVFRPLSVFTKSMLVPFDQNFEQAFDVLKSDSPDRLKIASDILFPPDEDNQRQEPNQSPSDDRSHSLRETGHEVLHETVKPDTKYSPPKLQARTEKLVTPKRRISSMSTLREETFMDGRMDLATALKETSPEKDSAVKVNADFVTLCELPIPDESEHPAYAFNPFEVKTLAPLLFTTSNAEEIREHKASKTRTQETRSSSTSSCGSLGRKKSLFGLELSTPSVKHRSAISPSDETTLPVIIPKSATASVRSSFKGKSPTSANISQPRESTSFDRSSGVRKFSDLFKRKESFASSEPASPAWSPRTSIDTFNLDREELEKFLRRTTFTPRYNFDPLSLYPRHPNTALGWKTRNLKCTTCTDVICAVCHRVCCAFKAAVLASADPNDGSQRRMIAQQRVQEITKLYPYGKESPTFLQCTAGATGSDMGCGEIVCPDCCSMCPDKCCADTLCRRCKPDMWEECEWHKNDRCTLETGRV